jgi:hypothetical protein
MNEIDFILTLKEKVLKFIQHQKSNKIKGYYKYSYSGDLIDENKHCNVFGSIFALKIYFTLGIALNSDIYEAANHIKTFKNKNGNIYDKYIYNNSFLKNALLSLVNNDLYNIFNTKYIVAESRQAYSSLMLYNLLPETTFIKTPKSRKELNHYLKKLNWNNPWAAGSHFSHLLFFYKLALQYRFISNNEFDDLTDYTIQYVNQFQNKYNGGWFKGNQDERLIVNGAMKIISGLLSVNKVHFKYPEKLIDLCLGITKDYHACDNFNIIFVLNYASKLLNKNYRQNEIEIFAINRIKKYMEYFKSNQGGFSFFPNKSNHCYYGARITKGLNEADMHGTTLFLWGIAIITQILGIESKANLNVFIA